MKKIALIAAILLLAVTAVNIWVSDNTASQSEQVLPVTADREPPPAIGGAFTLTDQDGKTVKDSDYRGKVMLVFFGFTHCPDICPVTTRTLADTLAALGDKAAQVAPIFITVDPDRDTPAVLKTYFANIDPRITGLTGTPEQLKDVADAYKAYFSKADEEEAAPQEDEDEEAQEKGAHHDHHGHHAAAPAAGDYNVNHSGYVYLMGKDGVYVKHFPYDAPSADIVAAVSQYLQSNP